MISLPSENITTGNGAYRYKYSMRAGFRAVAFVTLVAGFCVYNVYSGGDITETAQRRLTSVEAEKSYGIFQEEADPMWTLVLYIFGILYLFLALAIVCDEYFVPALEEMSGENQMNLSRDVAGATLMAAGGSAPELFTSLFGTFSESSVGFGTIVGSAVFNVLFVIGMCSLLSKEVLQLTWWPLFRDSSYYAVSLLVLAIFVGVVTPEEIVLWEAIVLFVMYLGYVGVMGMNEKLYKMITGKEYQSADEEEIASSDTNISFKYHTTFRAGLLTLIRDPDSWLDKARIGFVSKIAGNVDDVFKFVDENGDGEISREELQKCLDKLESQPVSETELDKIMSDLDKNDNGCVSFSLMKLSIYVVITYSNDLFDFILFLSNALQISQAEFKAWYLHSEQHVTKQIKKVFEKYDVDSSGSIAQHEFKTMLAEIEPTVSIEQLTEATSECFNAKTEITFDDFTDWYLRSTYYERQQKKVEMEQHEQTLCEQLSPPSGEGLFALVKYVILLPLVASLALTIPDVRKKSVNGKFCYLAFFLAIAWIGIYSYFMVGWAEIIGRTFGIPSYIMGLTFLAAGTSVPDLISSVIVARMGEGDMAVSSSIGSNIFDILVGLPLPWIAYILWPDTKSSVLIGADGIWVSIMILLGMLVLIVFSIHLSKWRLTKTLGFAMFFFYFIFLLQAILREYL